MRRLIMLGVVVSLIYGLWGISPAQAITQVQLCGDVSGLADRLVITGFDVDGGPFVMVTGWAQVVPTLYSLLGAGTFIRTPGDVTTFSAGLIIVNNSTAFANNPICAVSPVIQQVQGTQVFTGTAELRCVAGGSGTFLVTINFALVPCDDPGPFIAEAESFMLNMDREELRKLSAGYAPNEYQP